MTAVDDLSFDVAAGTVTGFVGANGAGKSTTMRMILGLVRPSAGDAHILGRPYAGLNDPRRVVGAVLDGPGAHPSHTARRHLGLIATSARLSPRRVDEVLGLVELAEHAGRRVGTFSMGMRQRLALAAAMLGDPSILVLDEPANGLDPPGMVWMRATLRSLADEGRAVLVSSHLLAELAEVVDRVVIIDRGRLVADSTLTDLLAGESATVELRCAKPAAAIDVLRRAGSVVRTEGAMLIVSGISAREVGDAVAQADAGPVYRLVERVTSFEDAYFERAGTLRIPAREASRGRR